MSKTVDKIINFPINTDLDNMLFYYRALFNAQGIKNNLPDVPLDKTRPFGNSLASSDTCLKMDFASVNKWLYQTKLKYGDVEIVDFKIQRDKARIIARVGK